MQYCRSVTFELSKNVQDEIVIDVGCCIILINLYSFSLMAPKRAETVHICSVRVIALMLGTIWSIFTL